MKPELTPSAQGSAPIESRATTGRPRDPRIDRAVMDAATELLLEHGYAGVTFGAIARRAGTTTPALYRRWPSKAHLIHEVCIPAEYTGLPQSTGNLADDLRAIAQGARVIFGSPIARAALTGLLADIAAHPELHDRLLARFQEGVFAGFRARIADAVETGEVDESVDADRVLEVIAGATVLRLMLGAGQPIDDDWVDQVTDLVLHGLGPRAS